MRREERIQRISIFRKKLWVKEEVVYLKLHEEVAKIGVGIYKRGQ